MLRQMWTAVLVVIAIVAAAWCCTAALASGNIRAEKKPGTNSIAMKIVLIPAGEFMMGNSHKAEDDLEVVKPYHWCTVKYFDREYPRHRVRITRPFYLGAYAVTVGQFRRFVESTGYQTEAEKSGKGAAGIDPSTRLNGNNPAWSWRSPGFKQTDSHPVVSVSWNDAVAFCKWLSRKESKRYSLPSEAEWEYACRAGSTTRFYNGEDPEKLADIANVYDLDCDAALPGPPRIKGVGVIQAHDGYVYTAPVGSFRPNAFGLYDMTGNVQQWCADWDGDNYYRKSPVDDPTGPKSGVARVVRGSSWVEGPETARSASREGVGPDWRDNEIGFRVARSLSDSEMREYAKRAKPEDAKKAEKRAR